MSKIAWPHWRRLRETIPGVELAWKRWLAVRHELDEFLFGGKEHPRIRLLLFS
jgi:hypothetical protein